MNRLYKYTGSVLSIAVKTPRDVQVADLMLYNPSDDRIAPTRINAFGGMAQYLNKLEWTDDEERYLDWNFYYDSILNLVYVEIPSTNERVPAKIIASPMHKMAADGWDFRIFGQKEHITTDKPEPMSQEDRAAWCEYRISNEIR